MGGGGGEGGCHLPCVGLTWQGMRERYEGRGGGELLDVHKCQWLVYSFPCGH